jgi:hypothetical protein
MKLRWIYNDGGRKAAGFSGQTGDCVCRAIAIASGRPYEEVYKRLADGQGSQRRGKRRDRQHGQRTVRHGISVQRKWFRDYMVELGATWTPAMKIGTGCQVHFVEDELPSGRLVVAISRHYVAVIDGIVHDIYLPNDRGGTRCVYGWWTFP